MLLLNTYYVMQLSLDSPYNQIIPNTNISGRIPHITSNYLIQRFSAKLVLYDHQCTGPLSTGGGAYLHWLEP